MVLSPQHFPPTPLRFLLAAEGAGDIASRPCVYSMQPLQCFNPNSCQTAHACGGRPPYPQPPTFNTPGRQCSFTQRGERWEGWGCEWVEEGWGSAVHQIGMAVVRSCVNIGSWGRDRCTAFAALLSRRLLLQRRHHLGLEAAQHDVVPGGHRVHLRQEGCSRREGNTAGSKRYAVTAGHTRAQAPFTPATPPSQPCPSHPPHL